MEILKRGWQPRIGDFTTKGNQWNAANRKECPTMTMFRFTIGFGLLFGLMAFGTLTAALVSAHGTTPK